MSILAPELHKPTASKEGGHVDPLDGLNEAGISLRDGDPDAFNRIFKQMYPFLVSYVQRKNVPESQVKRLRKISCLKSYAQPKKDSMVVTLLHGQ